MLHWFQLIRLKNIFIALASGLVIYNFFLLNTINRYDLFRSLDTFGLILLMISLSMIMAGGYIINDISDVKTDEINNRYNPISLGMISQKLAFRIYLILLILGTCIAIYLAFSIARPYLALLFPLFYGLMYLYSTNIKHRVLLGNLLISIACGGIPLLFLLAEWPAFSQLKEINFVQFQFHLGLILFSAVFMFLITLVRELIKDLEDMEGDKVQQSNTIPLKFGEQIARLLADVILLILLAVFVFWSYFIFSLMSIVNVLTTLIPIVLLIFYIHRILNRHPENKDYHLASGLLKLMMLFGLIHLILISYRI